MAKNSFKDISVDLLTLTFLFAVMTIFAGEMAWGAKVPFFRDLNHYFYPLRYSLSAAFQTGEVPLWNRHMGMGFPLLADIQMGVFYPPHWLLRLLPLFDAVRAIYLLHYFIAVGGAYLLWRHWEYPSYQAAVGALVFALGGTMVSLLNLLNHFQSAAWLPWSVLIWEIFLQRASRGYFVLFVIVLLCQLLGGSPEIFVMSVALLWIQGLWHEPASGFRKFLKPTCWLFAATAVVLLLAVVQLLPLIELASASRRQGFIPFFEATMWSLNPWNLLNLLFVDKQVELQSGRSLQLFFNRNTPFFISYYFSAVAIPAVGFWLYYAMAREKILVGIAFCAALLLALGQYTPVYAFLYDYVAPFRTFRFPEKFFFLAQAFLLIAVMRGIFTFMESDRRQKKTGFVILGCLIGFMLAAYVFLRFWPRELWALIVRQQTTAVPAGMVLDYAAAALVNLERQLVILISLFMLFLLNRTGSIRPPLFKALFVLVVFCDLYSAHQRLQYLLDPKAVVDGPRVLAEPDNPPTRLFYYPESENLHPAMYVIHKSQTSFREIATMLATNLLPNTGVLHGFDYMQDINALGLRPYNEFLWFINNLASEKRAYLLGAMNVRYVMSFHSLKVPGLRFLRRSDETSWLYEVERVTPRTYVVQNTEVVANPVEIMKRYSSSEFEPTSTVFVDQALPRWRTKQFSAAATIVRYGHQSVELRVTSNGPGVVVLADSYFPGWRVYVDGLEQKVLRANYFFRGVAVEGGEHRVEFKYEPLAFKVGLIISLSAALLLCLITLVLLIRTRSRIHLVKSGLTRIPAFEIV